MGASGTRLDVYHKCNVIAGVPRGHFRTKKRLEQNNTRLGAGDKRRGEERGGGGDGKEARVDQRKTKEPRCFREVIK